MTKLWGGRFRKETNPLVEKFTRSIQFDHKLAECDILGSQYHTVILFKIGYLKQDEAQKLIKGLQKISKSIENDKFLFDPNCEDIHTDIQNKLQADPEIGDIALKLHTARSRNDQVVFATKFYCKFEISKILEHLSLLEKAILSQTENNDDIIIPGFTHLQHAQPVYLKDYLAVYVQMFLRDSERLMRVKEEIKLSMGSGALAGTPIPAAFYNIHAAELFKEFELKAQIKIEPTMNSLYSVSDRDFVIEIISALSIVAMHLSRLSEDLIIWSTKEFDFIEIDDAFCTGSSLMPQKKNPDVLELIRGNTGRLYGNLVSVLTMMKGLPLTYNRDMQLDKEPLFNSFEVISEELQVLEGLIKTLKFNRPKIEEHLKDESLYATDLVYYLVEKGVPFKIAHNTIGELVSYSLSNNIQIKDIPEDVLKQKFSGKIVKKEFNKLFDPKVSVESKKSINRTAQ